MNRIMAFSGGALDKYANGELILKAEPNKEPEAWEPNEFDTFQVPLKD